MTMKIALGADHAGFHLKEQIREELLARGYNVIDVGAYEYVKTDDYPDFSAAVAQAVVAGEAERGILICGSGVGACIAANKVKGARACLCHDIYSATQGVEHDDMNILCLGSLIAGAALVRKLIDGFLTARYQAEERFQRRLEKVLALEEANWRQ
jgi:ribose 5-phosphate isomerase B